MAQRDTHGGPCPCEGHRCDNCYVCRQGKCCKRDVPGYRLPALGDWDGPVFGKLGVLQSDGEKVECHCCGLWFGNLGSHVAARHGMSANEYRASFGLRQSTSLIGPQTRARKQQHNAHLARVRPQSPFRDLTWAQRSACPGSAEGATCSTTALERSSRVQPNRAISRNARRGIALFSPTRSGTRRGAPRSPGTTGENDSPRRRCEPSSGRRPGVRPRPSNWHSETSVSASTIYDILEGRTWQYVL